MVKTLLSLALVGYISSLAQAKSEINFHSQKGLMIQSSSLDFYSNEVPEFSVGNDMPTTTVAKTKSAKSDDASGIRKGQLVIDVPLGFISGRQFTSSKTALEFGGSFGSAFGYSVGIGYLGYNFFFPSGKQETGDVPVRLLPFAGLNYYFAFASDGTSSASGSLGVLPSLGVTYRFTKDWSGSVSFPGFLRISYWLK